MPESRARRHSPLVCYAGALGATAGAILLRWLLHPLIGNQLPFGILFLALLPSALYFGLWPSILALIAGTSANIFITGENRLLPVGTFLVLASLSVYIIGALRRANFRAEDNARLADERLEELRRESAQLAIEERLSAQLRAIVESSEDAIISKSIDGTIQSWNAAAAKIFGFAAEEAIGQPITILVPSDRLDEEKNITERLHRGDSIRPFETVRCRKDGRQIPVSLTISPIHDAAGKVQGASHIARDIRELKEFEVQLRQTQKMESLGVLAGGLAHDFNNLLTGIMGNASLIVDDEPVSHSARRRAIDILDASERAALLVRQMLAYAGKARIQFEHMDVGALLEEMTPILRTSIPRLINLDLQIGKDLPVVEADRSQMQQLVTNLVINAAEAMEGRVGDITIAAHRQTIDAQPHLVLEFRDTGCGMDEPTQARIFDPFYSTKFTGRGLGLAAVMGIIRSHRGAISVDSIAGAGTTFTVVLPAAPDISTLPIPEPVQDTRGFGSVLVVDDEELVRNMARISLERCGYSVEVAVNGKTAVEAFSARPGEFAVVLLDLAMPVMDGEEALRLIKKIRPDVAVVLSSGYSEMEAINRFQDRGLSGFLQKPYTATALARKIKQALREKNADSRSAT